MRTVNDLGLLFKDARATVVERRIMLAALKSSPELTDISARARLTLQNLRQRRNRNVAAAKRRQG